MNSAPKPERPLDPDAESPAANSTPGATSRQGAASGLAMASDHLRRADESTEEELVAYLDGELSAAETARIERRLTDDAEYRERLRALQQAWDLLDLIPRADVQQAFTRSTVEMVAVTAADDVDRSRRTARRRRLMLRGAGIAAVLIAGTCGFWAATWWMDRPNRAFVSDLPVIVDLNLYRQAESTLFLDELARRGLFAEAPPALSAEADERENELGKTSNDPGSDQPSPSLEALVISQSNSQRRELLGQLPTAELDSLRRKKGQFDAMTPEEQNRIREFHAQVSNSSQSPQWRTLMERYNEWLKTISSADRLELRKLACGAKADKVAELVKLQEAERFNALLEGHLGREDLDKISHWLDDYVRDHETSILAALPRNVPEEVRRQIREAGPVERRRMLTFGLFRAAGRDGRLGRLRPEQLTALKESLSAEAQAAWDKASEEDRPMIAQKWLAAAFWSKAPPPVTEEQLRAFYKSRDAKQREWLERLPPDRMSGELRRLYYREQMFADGRGEAKGDGRRDGPGGDFRGGAPWRPGPWDQRGGERDRNRSETPKGTPANDAPSSPPQEPSGTSQPTSEP